MGDVGAPGELRRGRSECGVLGHEVDLRELGEDNLHPPATLSNRPTLIQGNFRGLVIGGIEIYASIK